MRGCPFTYALDSKNQLCDTQQLTSDKQIRALVLKSPGERSKSKADFIKAPIKALHYFPTNRQTHKSNCMRSWTWAQFFVCYFFFISFIFLFFFPFSRLIFLFQFIEMTKEALWHFFNIALVSLFSRDFLRKIHHLETHHQPVPMAKTTKKRIKKKMKKRLF